MSSAFFGCFCAYTACVHNCFRMSTGNGKGACASFPRCLRGWLHGVLWTGMYLVNHGKSASATLPTQQEFTLLFHVQTLCVAGYFNCIKRNPFLVAVILHSHNTLSLTGDLFSSCATVWVCKCLQLIYLSWQSAPCLVAYPSVSVATTQLSESVLLAVSIALKGILLLTQWHCIRITVYHQQPVIQYNVGQTWGLLTAALFEFANVCSWCIWVHST